MVLQQMAAKTPVFLHPAAFSDKRALIPAGTIPLDIPIGMRQTREDYEKAGADFRMVHGFAPITKEIAALSDVKHEAGWQTWDTRLKVKMSGELIDDPFSDDLSLLIETGSGPVVLLGCAHAGIVEILNDISERTGFMEFYAVIGGSHLASASEDYVTRVIETLRRYHVRKVGLSHCTGFQIACRFASAFRNEFVSASVGAVFEF